MSGWLAATYVASYDDWRYHHRAMTRQPRFDAADILHHAMVRGIERPALFRDDADRTDFVARLAAPPEPCAPWSSRRGRPRRPRERDADGGPAGRHRGGGGTMSRGVIGCNVFRLPSLPPLRPF
jgi:hypothetical protein